MKIVRSLWSIVHSKQNLPSVEGKNGHEPINQLINNQFGQIAVVLLLFVLVALAIGLAVTQRSLTNITTSSQTEQASRAFSAAEAGIEYSINQVAVTGRSTTQTIGASELNNQSQAKTKVVTRLPKSAADLGQTIGQALEYPPIGKDAFAQFWLANPLNPGSTWSSSTSDPGNGNYFYGGSSVDIYYGLSPVPADDTPPAVEVNLITYDGTNYLANRTFYDTDSTRRASNGFSAPSGCSNSGINTSSSASNLADDRNFLACTRIALAGTPIMLRARILYSNVKQPIAVRPVGAGCAFPRCSLPYQAAIYTATGVSGQSQKTLQVFRQTNFMPAFLDFAIFSSGEIVKR